MGETQERTDDLSPFAELLDDAPAATGSTRAARIALIVVLVTILAVLSDAARPADARAGLAWLDLNDLGRVVDWVCGWLKMQPQVLVDEAVKD